jgi:hypothetical protein
VSLPEVLLRSLDGRDLASQTGETFVLSTVGEHGWPHLAMLSAGELLAISARELRLALHAGSGTSANLARSGRGTLLAVADGGAITIRLLARLLGHRSVDGGELALFDAEVAELTEHRVGYAELESGIRFRLPEPELVLARWERTHDVLREARA